jgi:hypothetical protein
VPVSAAALVIAIGLVPGYLFLWLTAHVRKPGTGTTVSELLEVLLVGVATTGITAAAFVIARPSLLRENAETFHHLEVASDGEIRSAIGTVVAILAISLGVAWLLAQCARWVVSRRHSRYVPNVFDGTFNTKPTGHYPHVQITMLDGSTVGGPLLSFSNSDSDEERMISLKRPIRRWPPGQTESKLLPHDQFIAMGSQMKFISISHKPIPLVEQHDAAKSPRSGGGSDESGTT